MNLVNVVTPTLTNESTAAREFKVEMLPSGTVKTVAYNGRQAEVTF